MSTDNTFWGLRDDSLPPELYRVQHTGSQNRWSAQGDLFSQSSRWRFNKPAFREAVMQHLDWSSREDSCFLSVFADWRHAHNWASSYLDRSRPYIRPSILTVSTVCSEMIGFRVVDLVEKLCIAPHPNFRYSADEYLIWGLIPQASITGREFV